MAQHPGPTRSVDATSIDGGLLGNVDPATLRAELRNAIAGVEPGHAIRRRRAPVGRTPALETAVALGWRTPEAFFYLADSKPGRSLSSLSRDAKLGI